MPSGHFSMKYGNSALQKKPTNDVTSAEVPLFTHLKSVIFSIIKVDEILELCCFLLTRKERWTFLIMDSEVGFMKT